MNLSQLIEPNPIIVKELRSRMRGARVFITLTAALTLLAVVGYSLYRVTLTGSQNSSTPISPQIGQMLFAGLAFFELLVIAVVTPSVTAGEISSEKEKQTYEMLLATPLNPTSILWGKLVAAMSYVFLIIFAAVPMASLVFIYGGVSIRDMVKTLISLVVIAVLFGVIGLFFSSLFTRTGRATVCAYLAIALLLFGPLFAGVLAGVLNQGDPPRWMISPSPFMVLASAFQPSVNPDSISSTFWMIGSPVYWIMGRPPISLTSIPRPAYHLGLPVYLFVTIILYLVSTRLVKPVRKLEIHWSEAVLAFVILLGFLGFVTIGYLSTTNRYENIKVIAPATPTPFIQSAPQDQENSPNLMTTPVPESPEIAPKGYLPPQRIPPEVGSLLSNGLVTWSGTKPGLT